MNPLVSSTKMTIVRYPHDSSKTRVVICFDNNKSDLITNLEALTEKYKFLYTVIFVFTGHGENNKNTNNLMTNDNDSLNINQITNMITSTNIFCYLDYCESKIPMPQKAHTITHHNEKRYVIMTSGQKEQTECTTKFNGSYMTNEIIKNIGMLDEIPTNNLFTFTELIGKNAVKNQLVRGYYKELSQLITVVEKCKILEQNKNITPFQLVIQMNKNLKVNILEPLRDWTNCLQLYKHFNNTQIHESNPKIMELLPEMNELIFVICNKLPQIYINSEAIKRLKLSNTKHTFANFVMRILCNNLSK